MRRPAMTYVCRNLLAKPQSSAHTPNTHIRTDQSTRIFVLHDARAHESPPQKDNRFDASLRPYARSTGFYVSSTLPLENKREESEHS